MEIYIIMGITLLILLLKKHNNVEYDVAMLLLTMLSMLRAESVGADMQNYISEYYEYSMLSWKKILTCSEYSFAVVCKILNVLEVDKRGFIIAISILFSLLLWTAFKANRCNNYLVLYLYYMMGLYIQSFCIIRQSLAVVVSLIANSYLEEEYTCEQRDNGDCYCGKFKSVPIKYVIGIIIAFGFHPTVIVIMLIPIFMMYYGKKKKLKPVVFLRDGLICMGIGMALFPKMYPFVLRNFREKYQVLYGNDYAEMFGNIKSGILIVAVCFIFYALYLNNWKKLSVKENIIVGSVMVSSFALSSLSVINSTLGRVNLFTEGLMVVMMSRLMKNSYRKIHSMNFWGMMFFLIYFILYIMRDSIGVVPYKLVL